jgi:hypothetical protein
MDITGFMSSREVLFISIGLFSLSCVLEGIAIVRWVCLMIDKLSWFVLGTFFLTLKNASR